ncbi:MAG: bifunctional 2',3'-cyclic-nucleotide 2'-phosphodiesterase/3'-nucleotidase [Pseudomonadota bacterium]
MNTKPLLLPAIIASLFLLAGCGGDGDSTTAESKPTVGTQATLALLETTDLHANIMSYDYFKLAEDKSLGFERTATLIKQARAEFANTMLLDNGDTIQGTVLGDYQAIVSPISCDTTHAMYKAMNTMGYDAGTIGNHEFNFGLPFLSQTSGVLLNVDAEGMPAKKCAGPNFPQVLANVNSSKDSKPLFQPYTIIKKTLKATDVDGKSVEATIDVGVIGFTTPPIMSWDKRWLDGKVYITDTLAVAKTYVDEMRAEGADIVVFLEHGGLDGSEYSPAMENMGYYLARVQGVDAMFLGHSHQVFPNASSTVGMFNLPGVDKTDGYVNGVPSVMGSYWGKSLGVIKLALVYGKDGWYVDQSNTSMEARSTRNSDGTYVDVDPTIAPLVAAEHQDTINYVMTPIGDTDFRMSTYFADVGDVSAIEVVNQAQAAYVADYIQNNLPQYSSLPVLSVSAPFKSGFGGGGDYTDVAQGDLAINNAADLYLYPNTVYAVKVTGADIKNWLETAAKRFNQIDPTNTEVQELISTFPGYNFDVFSSSDISYQIDVTQPVGSRIVNLMYNGAAMNSTDEFVVATNNYRASGGGSFPGLDGSKTIYAAPDANRDVLIAYIKKLQHLTRANHGSDRSWSFKQVTTAGPVVFHSGQNKLPLAQEAGLSNISVYQDDDGSGKGLSIYQIDLSK